MDRRGKPKKVKADAKRPFARKPPKDDSAKVRDLEKRLAEALKRETDALEQQTATAEILRVISTSPTDARPVFDAIAKSSLRLCAAKQGIVFTFDGELMHLAAVAHIGAEGLEALRQALPARPDRGSVSGRAILTKAAVHVASVLDDPEYAKGAWAQMTGFRSGLAVPMMLQDGKVIGAVGIGRAVHGPFSDREVALLQTFADQAVIAIENVRLFKELEARNRDLAASGQILQVISRSPTDEQPVFEAIADSVFHLFEAVGGSVIRYDGELISMAAARGGAPGSAVAATELYQMPHRPMAGFPPEQSVLTNAMQHVADIDTDPSCGDEFRRHARKRGFRSLLSMPMLCGADPVGAIAVSRAQPGGFSTAEID